MFISNEKSEENDISNSNISNFNEPKINENQRSGIDPSNEIRSKVIL